MLKDFNTYPSKISMSKRYKVFHKIKDLNNNILEYVYVFVVPPKKNMPYLKTLMEF